MAIACGAINTEKLLPEEIRKINRQVINTRGEIFFSKVIVFFEGETEEQALPIFAKKYFDKNHVELGIDFVGVGGYGDYLPFLRVAEGLKIPWLIFSDAEQHTKISVKKQFSELSSSKSEKDAIIFLTDANNYEKQLISDGYNEEVRKSIIKMEIPKCKNAQHVAAKQEEIVNFGRGTILVKASAGSGKTRVLTERIKKLIDTTKRKILAITFTNKAGEEMKERLGNLDDIKNRLFIGTFHGFCQQVLENHGQIIGFANIPHIFDDESDRLTLVEQAIQQTPSYQQSYEKLDTKQQKELCYRTLNYISEVKRKLLSEDQLLAESEDEDLVLLYTTYQDILNSQNAIDFDDL